MSDPGRLARQPEPPDDAASGEPSVLLERGQQARWLQAARLLTGLVHELKNPLAVVQGYGQLLMERCPEGSEDQQDVELLLAEVQRVVRLVDDLQLYVRPGPEALQLVDVAETLESAVALSRHRLREARASVEIELPHGVPAVLAPRVCLLHAVVSLLLAAADELDNPAGVDRRVRISGQTTPGRFVLAFSWTPVAGTPGPALDSRLAQCGEPLERAGGSLRAATQVESAASRRYHIELVTGDSASGTVGA